jgi:hypothetical protein
MIAPSESGNAYKSIFGRHVASLRGMRGVSTPFPGVRERAVRIAWAGLLALVVKGLSIFGTSKSAHSYVIACIKLIVEQKPPKSEDGKMTVPSKHLMATLPLSHGIFDTNAVSLCPREGHEDILATAGDDGIIRVWRVC